MNSRIYFTSTFDEYKLYMDTWAQRGHSSLECEFFADLMERKMTPEWTLKSDAKTGGKPLENPTRRTIPRASSYL